jgi:hypothetical protein
VKCESSPLAIHSRKNGRALRSLDRFVVKATFQRAAINGPSSGRQVGSLHQQNFASAMDDGENINAIASDGVDDAVRAFKYFADRIDVKLGDDAPGMGKSANLLRTARQRSTVR